MRRFLVAVALAASLSQPAFFEPLWAFLFSVWSGVSDDAGCGWDPNGECMLDTQEGTDAGCGWDPYGCPNS